MRSPDPQAYLNMTPGRVYTWSSRLVELCPRGTFARPGLYRIHARLDATETGEEFGLEAYVGRITTEDPVTVRIRTGESPEMARIPRMQRAEAAPEPAP